MKKYLALDANSENSYCDRESDLKFFFKPTLN